MFENIYEKPVALLFGNVGNHYALDLDMRVGAFRAGPSLSTGNREAANPMDVSLSFADLFSAAHLPGSLVHHLHLD